MRLYNTMTRRLEDCEPGPLVTLYVCGVTPYDTTHLGHAFSYGSFDVLVRFLRFLGREVRYTQNVTDIDDDIMRRARQVGIPWDVLGRDQTERYQRDMADLNIDPPTHYPRATDEIPGMIATIERLLLNGNGYRAGGNVYFSAATAPSFGALSRLSRQQMLDRFAETGDSPDDPNKRDALDFVLWKTSAAGEPFWPAPWGHGRPGWHVECSTMATHYLGPSIDIHGGGDDLIFPHHSCEIAQSEEATGVRPFAKIWMHNGVVRLGGIKMSKSLGNLVMARELLGRYPADAIRLYLHAHQYRSSFDYDEEELRRAARTARDLARRAADEEPDLDPEAADAAAAAAGEVRRRFVSAMADDLNTPVAVLALGSLLDIPGPEARAALLELGGVLGLRLQPA